MIGLVLLAGAALAFLQAALFVLQAERTDATFVGAVERTGGNHAGTFLYPRFRFATRDGRVVTVTESTGATDQPYADGEKVAFLYDPRDPRHAQRESILLWLVPLILAPLGLLFAGIPAAVFLALRRAAKRPAGS